MLESIPQLNISRTSYKKSTKTNQLTGAIVNALSVME